MRSVVWRRIRWVELSLFYRQEKTLVCLTMGFHILLVFVFCFSFSVLIYAVCDWRGRRTIYKRETGDLGRANSSSRERDVVKADPHPPY